MYILDTDHLSLIQRNGEDGKRIIARLASIANPEVAVTVITYEEQVKGRLSVLATPFPAQEYRDSAAQKLV